VQLQKAPLGLLGAFALKVLGRNPPQFSDVVVPTADVYDQYLATQELQQLTVAGNANLAASNTRTFTVPNGKVWRLIGAGAQIGLNVADVALKSIITVNIQSPNGGLPDGLIGSGVTDTGGAAFRAFGLALRPPIFLPSGWIVGLGLNTSAALTVAVPMQGTVLVQEIDL